MWSQPRLPFQSTEIKSKVSTGDLGGIDLILAWTILSELPPLQRVHRSPAHIETLMLETPTSLGDDPWVRAHPVNVTNPPQKISSLQSHGVKGCRVFSKV